MPLRRSRRGGINAVYSSPMQYGFVIDHDRCIGCHACTVACKSENDVPLGSFRTWVKYTEKETPGTYPAIRRHFSVLRCNHCTNAPCVTICPVNALEKRPDGIVDIDRDACIGCRACMQACPYDAIYLNEDLGAVEKCHFCAHRIEKNLEPACAVVCPENAIIAGDVHDPESTISKLIRENDMLVRRPEQKTGPNVYYKGALKEALEPGLSNEPETFIWTDRRREPPPQPLSQGEKGSDTTTVLNAEHKVEWGWPVALYLVTKGVAAGVAMLAPFIGRFGLEGFAANYLPEIIALVFIGITGFLLVEDLKKPTAFIRLFTRPNWNSWLVKGAWVINAFVVVILATLALRYFGFDSAANASRWLAAACGVAVAGYTAFLFAQCEGRDLWQSKLLLPHLIVQALMCGSAVVVAGGPSFFSYAGRIDVDAVSDREAAGLRALIFAAALLAHVLLVIIEKSVKHSTANAHQAMAVLQIVRCGRMRCKTASGALLIAAAVLVMFAPWLAGLLALAGLYLYEYAYIRAGQLPPLS